MTNLNLKKMTVAQLGGAVLLPLPSIRTKAIFEEENAEFNKLYGQMGSVRNELKARPGDQRNALLMLFPTSQFASTIKSGDFYFSGGSPAVARELLGIIANSNRLPQAADAGLILNGLRDGSFVPS